MNRTALLLVLLCTWIATSANAAFIYDNTENATGSVGILGVNAWADDVHMIEAGDMTVFSFLYVANDATEATIRFYDNDENNTFWPGNGATLLHTEEVTLSFDSGLETIVLDMPVSLPKDLWVSIQFNGTSGAVPLHTPPVVGSSDPEEVSFFGTVGAFFGPGVNSFPFAIQTATANEPAALLLLVPAMLALGLFRRRGAR